MILGVSVVAQNDEPEDQIKPKRMYGMKEEAMLDCFEVAVIEQQAQTHHQNDPIDHLNVGLDPAELHKARTEAEGDIDDVWSADSRFSSLVHFVNACGSGDQGVDGDAGSILTRLEATVTE
ncbi:hypothetical protein COCMIDRAFT_7485 [Bipolaris oryzae ATCC 44560]|uniref:Uncharacterized protein n=1 Tax=Bipolaris oryzae ATCC 44560 TaxID=930090 RepID=W6YU77_COCMI|nr:uncharacterized protein COCMIDRAFT_7485 [Bipolaris oryzae ATCC 44560]EUC43012.1 hypothetical protein COCMIDRAFT_7485 [Bipolaris oryzae ATCC 44560]